MAEDTGRQRDFVLAPNEALIVQDRAKGTLQVHVGPASGTLQAGSDPVIYDPKSRRFIQTPNVVQATQQFPAANEGFYVVLENPATEEKYVHPELGNVNNFITRLDMGRKINVPGPQTFPLWPGQIATVVPGHQLRTNEYLVVRVYNDEAARKNWTNAVVKPADPTAQNGGGDTGDGDDKKPKQLAPQPSAKPVVPLQLTMGKLIVIRGDEVSFYIPPTGLEVVQDETGEYVREALTLERLEHCILLSESGEKRYERGPQVVFPGPTEEFVPGPGNNRKFRAIELNDDMGLYIKVTADYTEDDGTERKVGDELFITGKEHRLYFPRAEHKLIKYGDKEIHYGIAIPKGEARYVLDKLKGSIDLVKGPQIFLPDPRNQVIVRRVLSDDLVQLLYPGNIKAAEYNATLRAILQSKGVAEQPLNEMDVRGVLGRATTRGTRMAVAESAIEAFAGDSIDRGTTFTPPRTITLDTKFEGAVAIKIWNGYAVMIADAAGNQRVEVGPKTILLEYDEYPVVLSLSTGKPKVTDHLMRTVYLRVQYNHVTDIVSIITNDDVNASVKLVWRVNFDGEPDNWFRVENYVKFLCDRTRSILRGVAKTLSIQELSQTYIPVIRDAILGTRADGKGRDGLRLAENGVHIYDVEISELVIGDKAIADMLIQVQTASVKRAINLAQQEREYLDALKAEELKRKTAEAQVETAEHASMLEVRRTEAVEVAKRKTAESQAESKVHAAELALDDAVRAEETKRATAAESDQTAAELAKLETSRIAREAELAKAKHELAVALLANKTAISKDEQALETELVTVRLTREKAVKDQSLVFTTSEQKLHLEELEAETKAAVERYQAISPEFTKALQNFGTRDIATKLAEAVAPIAQREGLSIGDALVRMFKGTSLETVIQGLADRYADDSKK